MRVISFVGRSGAGKTTLIEHLIPELEDRGYKVAAVKHVRDGMDIDKHGKDSWRLAKAGSNVVITSSNHKLFLIKRIDHEPNFAEILPFVLGADIVLVEGFRKWNVSKIEVHPKGDELLCPTNELSAIVSNEPLDVKIPCFSPKQTKTIADFILENLMVPEQEVYVLVNDHSISLNPFVRKIISKVMLAMVSALELNEVKEIKTLNVYCSKKT